MGKDDGIELGIAVNEAEGYVLGKVVGRVDVDGDIDRE